MFNFLRTKLTPMKVYTAAEVHAEINAKVLVLMEELKKQAEAVSLPAEMQSEIEILKSVGLTRSKNFAVYEDAVKYADNINKNRELNGRRLELIKSLHKHYGTECMLMSLEDFMSLLDKYNLVCSHLCCYTGSVPQKCLEEIKKASDFCNRLKDFNLPEKIKSWCRIVECTEEYEKKKPEVRKFVLEEEPINQDFTWMYRNDDYRLNRKSSRLLIAAPAQEMDTGMKISERIRTEDPFVFSVTNVGVIIYSAWGDEGNDEVMQKYRKLNEWIASCDAVKMVDE